LEIRGTRKGSEREERKKRQKTEEKGKQIKKVSVALSYYCAEKCYIAH
jgi:hypothetical protein